MIKMYDQYVETINDAEMKVFTDIVIGLVLLLKVLK